MEPFELAAITSMRHPTYTLFNEEWLKWRITMLGGKVFLDKYLFKFSCREDDEDFANRKKLSYCAAYAKSAIKEVINAIFQRMRDITRVGGPDDYISAVEGREGGVNREGMSMNMFMGQKILPELLSMGKVGIYIDMPEKIEGATLADTYQNRPYLYFYRVEDILNWNYTDQELRSVVLRDTIYTYDQKTNMPNGTACRYRYIWQGKDNRVYVSTHDEKTDPKTNKTIPYNSKNYQLGLKRIPFILVDIGQSLLTDISDHQIALTNLESSDVSYIFKSNFPIFVKEKDNLIQPTHTKPPGSDNPDEEPGEVQVGPTVGISYPQGSNPPSFISPPTEPLQVSIEKQNAIRDQIRNLVHLSISSLVVSRASADSKQFDNQGLEAGLAFIGLTLEHAENFIGERWCEYKASLAIPTIKYPSQFSLQSDQDRRAAAKALFEMRDDVPSTEGRKELVKLAIRSLFDGRVSPEVMDNILDEIDAAKFVSGRTEDVERDKEAGLVSTGTASIARGYAPDEAAKAKNEFMERLKFINETQTAGGPGGRALPNPAARGVPDASPNPAKDAKAEKGN